MINPILRVRAAVLCTAAALAAACSTSNPSAPSSGTTGVPDSSAATASVSAPRAAQPAANTVFKFTEQPVRLTVFNAVVTQSTGTTYVFEVSTDSSFATRVQTKDNVPENTSGQTSIGLDTLAGGRDYYWRARATGGGTTGPYSATAKFTVGPEIVLGTPSPISPLTNTITTTRPTFRVTNATRSGPAGTITYRFEVASQNTFGSLAAAATVSEGINETGWTPNTDLPRNQTFFWRAFALDSANNVTSAASSVQSFQTRQLSQAESVALQLNQPLWPGRVPPGDVGHATMGTGWTISTLYYAPGNVFFQSPDIEMLRYFDLFDRGFHPDDAVAWMNANGYPSQALWYPPPEKAVLGLHYVYLASRDKIFVNGTWDVVLRLE